VTAWIRGGCQPPMSGGAPNMQHLISHRIERIWPRPASATPCPDAVCVKTEAACPIIFIAPYFGTYPPPLKELARRTVSFLPPWSERKGFPPSYSPLSKRENVTRRTPRKTVQRRTVVRLSNVTVQENRWNGVYRVRARSKTGAGFRRPGVSAGSVVFVGRPRFSGGFPLDVCGRLCFTISVIVVGSCWRISKWLRTLRSGMVGVPVVGAGR